MGFRRSDFFSGEEGSGRGSASQKPGSASPQLHLYSSLPQACIFYFRPMCLKKNTCTIRLKNVQHYIADNAMVDFKPLKAYALKQSSKLI